MSDGWLGSHVSGCIRRPCRTWAALLCLGLGLSGGIPLISPAAAKSDPFGSSILTVNAQLIFDGSGSMAELVPGTQHQTGLNPASRGEADFTALTQVESVPVTRGTLVGNAFEFLGAGDPGALSAVAAGLEDDTTLLLVARNNTAETVENVEANVTAFRGDLNLGRGTTMLTAPYVVEPGGVALIQVFFTDGGIAADDVFDLVFTSEAPGTTDPVIRGAALLVERVTPGALGLNVVQRNPYPFAIEPNQYQYAMCFDVTGTPHHYIFDTTVLTAVPPGAAAPELIADYRAEQCPYYLVTTAGDPAVDVGVAPLLPPVAEPDASTKPLPMLRATPPTA